MTIKAKEKAVTYGMENIVSFAGVAAQIVKVPANRNGVVRTTGS